MGEKAKRVVIDYAGVDNIDSVDSDDAMNLKNQSLPETIVSSLILHGDLSKLTPADKVKYYNAYCSRIGLDPVTQPFKILKLSGKETLYCDRSGTQQLNKLHNVSHRIVGRENVQNNVYIVIAQAYLPEGRQTESIGAVSLLYPDTTSVYENGKKVTKPHPKAGKVLIGEDFCNALMKAETKAKRRATLDLLGLGILDETEVESIQGAVTNKIEEEPPIVKCKAKLDEAKSLPHLQNIWKKHYYQWKETLSADDFADLTEYKEDLKDKLNSDFQDKQEAAEEAAKPEPQYMITQEQIDRIREIIKYGGTGICLTPFEKDKLADCANNKNSTKADTELLIEQAMAVIRQRETQAKEEMEGD